MKVILLSGVFEKRLKPLMDYLSMHLIPICKCQIIGWQIHYFEKFGIKFIKVCVGHWVDQSIKYLERKNLGVQLGGTKVKRFEEKLEMCNHWMNVDTYYLKKDILKQMPKNGNMKASHFRFLPKMVNYMSSNIARFFWKSVDSYKDMEEYATLIGGNRYEKFISSK